MSHQLIYQLRPATEFSDSLREVCARSYRLTTEMENVLLEKGRYRATEKAGPQFCYEKTEISGRIYHLLTCVCELPEEKELLVHHLALSDAEVAVLLKTGMRPTPAGVILSMAKNGFWSLKTRPEAEEIQGEAEIDLDALPDAAAQPTWMRLTGHKNNATKLNEPPFITGCLLAMPTAATVQDALLLLHESTWLSRSCGWGATFCTAADLSDVGSSTRILIAADGGETHAAAVRAGWSVLPVRPETQAVIPTRTIHIPYGYDEEADDMLYAVRPHTPRKRLYALCGIGAVVLTGATLVLLEIRPSVQPILPLLPPLPPATTEQSTEGTPPAAAPTATETPALTPPAEAPITEPTTDEGKPTHIPPADTAEDTPTAKPAAVPQPLGLTAEQTVKEQDKTGTEEKHDSVQAPIATGHLTVVMVGEPLPGAFLQMLRSKAPKIEYGHLSIAPMNGKRPSRSKLSGENPLQWKRTGNEEETWVLDSGNPEERVVITLQDGRLNSVSSGRTPVAVSLPLPQPQATYSRLVLMPRPSSVTAEFPALRAFPDAKVYIPRLTEEMLQRSAPTSAYPYGRLSLKGKLPPLPAKCCRSTTTLSCPLPRLDIAHPNSAPALDFPKGYHYLWKEGKAPGYLTGELSAEYTPLKALNTAFDTAANAYCCGDSGKGEGFYSLATLYGLMQTLDNPKLTAKERHEAEEDYVRLYSDKNFNAILHRILVHEPALTLPLSATKKKGTAISRRQRTLVLRLLRSADNRKRIRSRVTEVLYNTLSAAYTRKTANLPPLPQPELEIQGLRQQEDGSYEWTFTLHPAAKP